MNSFINYVKELEVLALAALDGNDSLLKHIDFGSLLNGGVGAELRCRVPLADRQNMGAFFTGENLRARTVQPDMFKKINGPIWDPACGAGDLLLSYGQVLPVTADIEETLSNWGKALYGNDIEEAFLRAAKARLVLAAYARGARKQRTSSIRLADTFPEICKRDTLASVIKFSPTEIVLNPPFVMTPAPPTCEWASGSISAAAAFIDTCCRSASHGARIVAILPDVLRTGSRYGRWRSFVHEFAVIERVDVYGAFDPQADVDVFILELTRRNGRITSGSEHERPWAVIEPKVSVRLGDLCAVSVGPVVPHRHPSKGKKVPYIHASDAVPWETLRNIETRRGFSGTVHMPPFIVVRRTSSPSDKFRATATLITGNEPVAIENHLIICKPNDGTIKTCRRILSALKSDATNTWLNSRIRCRHLTVGAVSDIPIE